jgi:hypothetical protein
MFAHILIFGIIYMAIAALCVTLIAIIINALTGNKRAGFRSRYIVVGLPAGLEFSRLTFSIGLF